MKNLLSIGKLALLGIALSGSNLVFAQYEGSLDWANCSTIEGWVANTTNLNTSYSVDIYDGSTRILASVPASNFRQDLVNAGVGNGNHGFLVNTPSSLINGQAHSITATPAGVALGVSNLPGSPISLTCSAGHAYGGSLDAVGCASIGGWAWDADYPTTALTVGVYVDGSTTASATFVANQYRADVKAAGIGTGNYGFTIPTPSIVQNGQTHSVSVRPVGVGTEVLAGSPKSVSCSAHLYTGWLDGADCTSIRGWAADLDNENVPQTVTVYVDGNITSATGTANVYRSDVQAAIGGSGNYGFSIPTPTAPFADGQFHVVTVRFGSPAFTLASSVPYSFSCDAYGVEGVDEGGGSCTAADVSMSATPTLTQNGVQTTYMAGQVSGFYLTSSPNNSAGNGLSTVVQGVVEEYGTAELAGSLAYRTLTSSTATANPFSDPPVAGNGLYPFSTNSGFTINDTFNIPANGDSYFGGYATVTNTCMGYSFEMGYVAFKEHVDPQPTITSVVSYPTPTPSGSPGPLIVGQPGTVLINGTNLGDAGTVSFTAPNGSSFQLTYTVSNQSQATINSVLTGVPGTYTLSLQETADGAAFNFEEAGAEGQPPKASATVTAINAPTYTVVLREFIRANHIVSPLPCISMVAATPYINYFRGDDRNFAASPPPATRPASNPYRLMQTAIIQPESAVSSSGQGSPSQVGVGTTREYDSGSLIPGPDTAGSGYIIDPTIPDVPAATCTGGAALLGIDNTDDIPAYPTITRLSDHVVQVTFSGQGSDPLIPSYLPGAIQWFVQVTIDHTNPQSVQVSAAGSTTCYPANEIWVTSSANPGAPYYVWEYGPGGLPGFPNPSPSVQYDESTLYLASCLALRLAPFTMPVSGSTTLPQ